jgi:hypothetical protein
MMEALQFKEIKRILYCIWGMLFAIFLMCLGIFMRL